MYFDIITLFIHKNINNMKNIFFFFLVLLFNVNFLQGQDESEKKEYVYQTWKYYKIVNMHSTETLPKRTLDVRIGHKFGDLAGTAGGWQTFYGLESAADIMMGVAYGITDDIGVGISRVKGARGLFQNMVGTVKYRFLQQQTNGGIPLTMTFVGIANMSTQKKVENSTSIQAFDKFAHRMAYSAQIIIARKFGERFSFQISPGYIHRNIVEPLERNGLPYLAAASRLQISKIFGIIVDATYPFSSIRTRANNYYPSVGVGLEIETGGHVFQVNFTNSRGITETDYIPYNQSSWAKGQFRLGFTISRVFNL